MTQVFWLHCMGKMCRWFLHLVLKMSQLFFFYLKSDEKQWKSIHIFSLFTLSVCHFFMLQTVTILSPS
jgi:hypothetical protein